MVRLHVVGVREVKLDLILKGVSIKRHFLETELLIIILRVVVGRGEPSCLGLVFDLSLRGVVVIVVHF